METTVNYLTFDEVGITVAVIAVALAFIILAWNAVKAISEWRAVLKKPTDDTIADHEVRIKHLEGCCTDAQEKLKADFDFQKDEVEMNRLLLRSIKHLIQHAVDGNDTKKLVQMEQEIDDYLLSHAH